MQISRIPRTPTSERQNREMGSGQRQNLPAASPRDGRPCGCSSSSMFMRLGLLQRSHHRSNNMGVSYSVLRQGMRRYPSDREILKRALAPPVRRFSHRWLNFRPTPSRLSNMSMACEAS